MTMNQTNYEKRAAARVALIAATEGNLEKTVLRRMWRMMRYVDANAGIKHDRDGKHWLNLREKGFAYCVIRQLS